METRVLVLRVLCDDSTTVVVRVLESNAVLKYHQSVPPESLRMPQSQWEGTLRPVNSARTPWT